VFLPSRATTSEPVLTDEALPEPAAA
jgi:hypothetical protein